MSNLEKETVDTLIKPDPGLALELELEGSSNELNQNQNMSADEVDFLGDCVPGYETTGEVMPMNEFDEEQEAQYSPTPP